LGAGAGVRVLVALVDAPPNSQALRPGTGTRDTTRRMGAEQRSLVAQRERSERAAATRFCHRARVDDLAVATTTACGRTLPCHRRGWDSGGAFGLAVVAR